MKVYLLLILLICTSLQAQTTFSQTSENQIDDFKFQLIEDSIGTDFLNSAKLTGTGGGFGNSVSSAGDVNGDGFDDIIIGAPGISKAFIYFGGLIIDTTADLTFEGISNSQFGSCVSNAGDVNGDGYGDVIIGAYSYSRAYIYYGGTNMNNVADLILYGEGSNDNFAQSVSDAGDVNDDGYDDIIVGAPNAGSSGKTYIYIGSSNLDNIPDVIMTNNLLSTGSCVSNAGDVNGDGYDDVILTAYNGNTGFAFIYYGGANMNNSEDVTFTSAYGISSVSDAGDVNGDGFADVIIAIPGHNNYTGIAYILYGGTNMDNIPDVTLNGEVATQGLFGYSVSTAGDLNRDGYSDVVVGAPTYNTGTGRAYIFYGGTSMNNIADIILTGESTNDRFGSSVSTARDVNKDGYSDVIIGANGYSSNKGGAYVYFNSIQISPLNNSTFNPVSINFLWKKLNTSVSYILQVSSDSAFNSVFVSDTILIDTFKTVSGFLKNSKYFWRVKTKDTSGITYNSSVWNFTTIPPIYSNIKLLFEGMYSPAFNQLVRKDSVNAYLHKSTAPFNMIDSAKAIIDSISFTGLFKFFNAPNGSYYISVKHLNSIETWSKAGGEYLTNDGTVYNYDFTTGISQAYGNNLKLKGSKYCLYSGDVNHDGYITLFDVIPIYNDATSFITGRYLTTDLTGDNIVDLTDVTLCYNNSSSFIRVIRP